MAKQIKNKSAFVKKHSRALDPDVKNLLRQPESKLWSDRSKPGVYAVMHPGRLQLFAV